MRTDGRRAPGFEEGGDPRAGTAPSRSDPGRRTDREEPGDSCQAPSRSPRGDLRDLLGDFSEQTGSHFG